MTLKKRIKQGLRWVGRTSLFSYTISLLGFIYTWLVGRTGKFEVHGSKEFDKLVTDNDGGIFVAWHGRALMLPYFWKNIRQMKALVSPHADGRIISRLLKFYHILTINGSTDKRANGAALDIMKELNQGTVIALISDGPRGPRMRLNKSAIYFAQKTGKPIMGFTYSSEDAKILRRSWDAMLIPRCFKKGVVYGTKPLFVPKDATEEEIEQLRLKFETELNELTFKADELCGIEKILPSDTKHLKLPPVFVDKDRGIFIRIYKVLIRLLFPIIAATYIKKRRKNGKEHPTRFRERLGRSQVMRPEGKLFWFHGASVGEAISMLPLIDKLLAEDKDLSIMVTTGTLTSAEIMEKRLPERAFHQFVPFDVPKFAKRLLTRFKPDAVLWFESELWPSLLSETRRRRIPLILVNGRISDKSFKHWKMFKFAAKELLGCFSLCLGQSVQDEERLKALGAPKVACVGNIKYAGMPLPVDEKELANFKQVVAGRPVFLISSTHHNEEEQLADELKRLQEAVKDVLVIVVPRHPQRGAEVVAMLKAKGFNVAQRSVGEKLDKGTEIYVADTIGEMGLWYKLAELTFIGGSLIAHGGQNFIEPARDENAVIVGPYMHNFQEMLARAKENHAVIQVNSAPEVISWVIKLFNDDKKRAKAKKNAYQWTVKEGQVLEGISRALYEELEHEDTEVLDA